MSRNHLQTIRSIRNEESLALRKKILKSTIYSKNHDNNIFDDISKSDEIINQKIANLQQYAIKTKSKTQKTNHQILWLQEKQRLKANCNKLEKDIQLEIQNMFTLNMLDRGLQSVVDEIDQLENEHRKDIQELLARWYDMKQLLPDETSRNGNPQVVNIFADMLLKLRSQYQQVSFDLKEEEMEIIETIQSDRQELQKELDKSRILDQNKDMEPLIHSQPYDDIDIDMYREELLKDIYQLDVRYREDCQKFKDESIKMCESLEISPEDKYGGWNKEQHEIFESTYKRFKWNSISRKVLMELLESQLPSSLSHEIIIKHEKWYRALKAISLKRVELQKTYDITRKQMIISAIDKLDTFRRQHEEKKSELQQWKEFEKYRELLHLRLQEMKAQNEAQLLMKQIEESKVEEIQKLQLALKQAEIAKEFSLKKQAIEEFHRRREQREMEEIHRREESKIEETRRVKSEIEKNKPAIEKRYDIWKLKQDNKKQQMLELEEKEMKKYEYLLKLAQDVPYFEAIQSIESKLDHITTSAKSHYYAAPIDPGRGHLQMYGFHDKKIISDTRLRIANALREHGLIHSEAAKQVIAAYHPRPHLAIHGLL